MKVACVGEAMIELSLDSAQDTAFLGVAGDTLNTAIYLRRDLPMEHDVAFVSVLGRDELSDRIMDFIAKHGVSTKSIQRHPDLLPGIYAISIDDGGERAFSYWRDNSAARTLFQRPDGSTCFDDLEEFDVIYTSAITLAILPPLQRDRFLDWIATFQNRGGKFVFDSNFRSRLWQDLGEARRVVAQAWRLCDIGLPSEDDERALFGNKTTDEMLERLKGYGLPTGALKRGICGPLPINAPLDASIEYPPAQVVVDTTAAGDSFGGAFLASFLTKGDLNDAMRAGHARASIVVGHRGAIAQDQDN